MKQSMGLQKLNLDRKAEKTITEVRLKIIEREHRSVGALLDYRAPIPLVAPKLRNEEVSCTIKVRKPFATLSRVALGCVSLVVCVFLVTSSTIDCERTGHTAYVSSSRFTHLSRFLRLRFVEYHYVQ